MSFIVYRQPAIQSATSHLVLGDWEEVIGVTSVPLFSSPTTKFIDIVSVDLTAEYGRKALITLENVEIIIAFGRDVTADDNLFIPPEGNIELEVGKQSLSASVFSGVDPAAIQVWTAKYFKVE